MMNASQAVLADTLYVDTFFRELSPVRLNHVAALHGVQSADLTAPFTYLELGCGMGRSTALHAACFPHAQFHACDINEQHVALAQQTARTWGVSNVAFHHAGFEQMESRDLPPFDFIVLHGVLSWVDEPAREALARVLARHLKPGGLVYVSYNCLPGWTVEMPLQRLLVELAQQAEGETWARAGRAVDQLVGLGGLRYFKDHPAAQLALEAYTRAPPGYVAHEFLSGQWTPFYSVDVADQMVALGLEPVGSATLVDNHPELVMDADAARVVAGMATPRLQQLAADFAVNRRFRRDVFARSPQRAAGADAQQLLTGMHVGCPQGTGHLSGAIRVPRGALHLQPAFMADLRALVDKGPVTLGEAAMALSGVNGQVAAVIRNLVYLLAAGALMPLVIPRAPPRPGGVGLDPVARTILSQVVSAGQPAVIPSPVLGTGVDVTVEEAQEILQCANLTAQAQAQNVQWQRLSALGMVVNG